MKEPENEELQKQIIELLTKLEPEQRKEVFYEFCTYCGLKGKRCQCWNDE